MYLEGLNGEKIHCHKKISITFQLELPHKFIIFLLTDMPHQVIRKDNT